MWEKTRTLWWREDTEVSWREEAKEVHEERVRGMRLWFLRESEQNHCIPLKLPPLLKALSIVVGNVRKHEGETNPYQVPGAVLGVFHALI